MPAIVNKSRKHQLKRTKTVKYSFVQRQIMVFFFGIQIVLVVDLIAMELLCCMTATILQSFWCQFWFGLQPFWFGISFSCQQNEWNWLKRTFSQPRWSSQAPWGGETPSGRPPAREWITLNHACSLFGLKTFGENQQWFKPKYCKGHWKANWCLRRTWAAN